jgi:hypothetical protein
MLHSSNATDFDLPLTEVNRVEKAAMLETLVKNTVWR